MKKLLCVSLPTKTHTKVSLLYLISHVSVLNKENLSFLNTQKGPLHHFYRNSEKVPVQHFYKIIHNFRFGILLELLKLLTRMKTRNVVSFLNLRTNGERSFLSKKLHLHFK